MKITHLASLHVPFDTRIFVKEAKSLYKAGHDVSLIVPHTHDDTIEGIRIIAVPLPENGMTRLTKTLFLLFKKALKQDKRAVIHFHDSELIIYAILLKLMGRKVVYDAHEDTPRQIMYQHWIPGLIRKPVAWTYYLLEKIGGWLFDGIIIAEPVIGRYFPKRKTILVRNFALLAEQKTDDAPPYDIRPNHMAYIGGITEARGAITMIEAAEKVPENLNFKFILGGSFHPTNLRDKVQSLPGWRKVIFKGWLSREEVSDTLNSVKIGIITPQPNPRYTTNFPVKMFEYMNAAIPVIASKEGLSKQFVERSNCGILVDPTNSEEIANSIEFLLTHPQEAEIMGKNGKKAILEKFNWNSEEEKLLKFYEQLEQKAS